MRRNSRKWEQEQREWRQGKLVRYNARWCSILLALFHDVLNAKDTAAYLVGAPALPHRIFLDRVHRELCLGTEHGREEGEGVAFVFCPHRSNVIPQGVNFPTLLDCIIWHLWQPLGKPDIVCLGLEKFWRAIFACTVVKLVIVMAVGKPRGYLLWGDRERFRRQGRQRGY